MGLLDYLFDSEYKQRDDIESLSEASAGTRSEVGQLQDELVRVRHRLDRTELVAEALARLLEAKGIATMAEVGEYIVRVDLEDGREDGMIGEDRSAKAPACPSCAKPANMRRRTSCVYCGAPLKPARGTAPYR
jgi:hypothetical protein